MPSRSLQTWQVDGRKVLGEIEAAHRAVRGTGRGRRFAAQQINQAYVVLLSSQFQRFCRDLHSESVEHLVRNIQPDATRSVVRRRFMEGRKLDAGNPNPGNIGSDFGRFGITFWPALQSHSRHARSRQRALEAMTRWRNAVAHQDFSHPELGGRDRLRLTEVRRWRAICRYLAVDFDGMMNEYLLAMTGTARGRREGQMSRGSRKKPSVAVGTRVRVPFPWHRMNAEVIEHRGFIGVGGAEMVRIRPLDDLDSPEPFDVPVDEIEVVSEPAKPRAA